MKKIYAFISLLIICATMSAQTLELQTKDGLTVLINADEAGEMIVSGSQISVGQEVFDLSELDNLTYSSVNFDPQLVEVTYSGTKSNIRVPLALLPLLTIEQDGAYVSMSSTASADPEIVYSLKGATTDGGFALSGDYKCGIILNGVNIASQRGAAIHVRNGKRIDVELAPLSTNRLADYAGGDQDACFIVKGHPEFKGNGSLYITGNARHAYKSGEYTEFKPSLGTVNITSAVSDAMHIGQYFHMRGGSLTISNGVKGDGIQVEKNLDPAKEQNGMLLIDSGTVNISLASDDVSGIKCDSTMTFNGGTYTINMSGKFAKGINAPHDAHIFALHGTPKFDITTSGGYLVIDGDKKKSSCFKVDNNIYFHAGNITTHATGDKSRGLKVGNDYYYVPGKAVLSPNTPDVGGAMRILSE